MAAVEDERPSQESRGGGRLFVREHLDVGQSRVVVDRHMHALPAGAAMAITSVAGDAVTDAADATEFLDVEVELVPRSGTLVSHDGLGRLEVAKTAHTVPIEDGGN